MKKLFEDDLKLSEFKKFTGNSKDKCNIIMIIFAVVGLISAITAVVFAITKLCKASDEFDFDDFDYDEDCDENGCYFTDEDDFEN